MNNKRLMKKLAAMTAALMTGAMGTVTAFAEEAAAEAAGEVNATGAMFTSLLLPIILLVFLYFIMIRPQRKQEKATLEMQKNLQVGDEVVTIGGIVGIVIRVEENTKTVVLETGSDRLKIRMMQDAIRENITQREQMEAEKKAKRAAMAAPAKKDE